MIPTAGEVEAESSTTSMEEAKTMAIGKELGFQIEIEDPILQEVTGENVEINVPKWTVSASIFRELAKISRQHR